MTKFQQQLTFAIREYAECYEEYSYRRGNFIEVNHPYYKDRLDEAEKYKDEAWKQVESLVKTIREPDA